MLRASGKHGRDSGSESEADEASDEEEEEEDSEDSDADAEPAEKKAPVAKKPVAKKPAAKKPAEKKAPAPKKHAPAKPASKDNAIIVMAKRAAMDAAAVSFVMFIDKLPHRTQRAWYFVFYIYIFLDFFDYVRFCILMFSLLPTAHALLAGNQASESHCKFSRISSRRVINCPEIGLHLFVHYCCPKIAVSLGCGCKIKSNFLCCVSFLARTLKYSDTTFY